MSTRSGQRDLATIYQIHVYMNEEFRNDYLSLIDCLSDGLKFEEPFPLLRLNKGKNLKKLEQISIKAFNSYTIRVS